MCNEKSSMMQKQLQSKGLNAAKSELKRIGEQTQVEEAGHRNICAGL
jgi:hypothetical protein